MDIASLPQDYFNTKKYFKESDKSLKDKGFVVDRYGRPIRKRKLKRTYSISYVIYFILSVSIVLVLAVLLLLVHFGIIRWGENVRCAPGFDIGVCERMDFLDIYMWSETKEYDANGNSCSSGVAFRTWAPKAKLVLIQIHNNTGINEYSLK